MHHSRNGFLTHKGYQLAEERGAQQISLEGLLPRGDCVRVDTSVSVSALVEVEDHWFEEVIDEQYRRFLSV